MAVPFLAMGSPNLQSSVFLMCLKPWRPSLVLGTASVVGGSPPGAPGPPAVIAGSCGASAL